MRFLIDMNLSPALVALLSDRGITSEHWCNIGALNAKDAVIMQYASENDFIVLTCDLDFSAILAVTRGQKPSVVQIRTHIIHNEELADLIAVAVPSCENELRMGAILTIDTKRARLRLLPL